MITFKLNELYRFLDISKQAVSKSRKRQQLFDQELRELVHQVDLIREEHPGCGVEKLYYTLRPKFMGRDKFCELFMHLGYRVRRIKNYRRTTIPVHLNYPNLIEGMVVNRPYQVIQSDITYFDIGQKFYFMVFIIDVYTREIVGFNVADNMRAEENVKALKMTLSLLASVNKRMIHHSDRGGQYGSRIYTEVLEQSGIAISMGLKAQDNAYAERVNGTIKNEYLKYWEITNINKLKKMTKKAVEHYNHKRKHEAFNKKLSPVEFKKTLLDLDTQERPKVIIYAEGNYQVKEASSHLDFDPKKEPQAHNCPIVI